MRLALEKHKNYGFIVTPARSRIFKARKITDAEFADYIVLTASTMTKAEELMRDLEKTSMSVG